MSAEKNLHERYRSICINVLQSFILYIFIVTFYLRSAYCNIFNNTSRRFGRTTSASFSWMCIASFNLSKSCLLALSRIFTLSHLIGWCSVQACSAIADLSNEQLWHASLCSLILVHWTSQQLQSMPGQSTILSSETM